MRKGPVVLSLAVAGLSLAACNQQAGQNAVALATGAPIASLPLADGAPPPLIAAPALASLPAAPPVRVVRASLRERYRYIDRAEALGEAFADSPPDYTVDYASVRPWIWRSNRGEYRVVEPTPEGERTYYFDAGSDLPFLVSDPEYSYGYDQGALAVIYTSDGRPAEYRPDSAERAARYLARARALHGAAIHQQRQAAYARAWRQRRAEVLAEQEAWAADRQRDAEWRDWRESHQRAEQADWNRERAMRAAYAATAVAAIVSAAESDHSRPPPAQPQFAPAPGQAAGPPPNQDVAGRHEDHRSFQGQQQTPTGQQASAQAQAFRAGQAEAANQQAQAAQLAAPRRHAGAARSAEVQVIRQADAARLAQAGAAQATARQQADAARAMQAQAARQAGAARVAQAEAVRRDHVQSAQLTAARRQADVARAAQAQALRQADAARAAQAQAARQADTARLAQTEAAHRAQLQGAQAAPRRQADAARSAQADATQRAQPQAQAQDHVQAQQAAAAPRGDAFKAKLEQLQAQKNGKPGDKKDHDRRD